VPPAVHGAPASVPLTVPESAAAWVPVPEQLDVSEASYRWTARLFAMLERVLRVNLKLQAASRIGSCEIFLFNHFARFETFIPSASSTANAVPNRVPLHPVSSSHPLTPSPSTCSPSTPSPTSIDTLRARITGVSVDTSVVDSDRHGLVYGDVGATHDLIVEFVARLSSGVPEPGLASRFL
jgi:hypothetical protein